ncbi:biotin--[acetyl-CoA-carboxylase] ligase [Geoglobus sp.]
MKIDLNDRRLQIFQELVKGGSGEEIAERLGVSRVAVWKFVKRLEELGYRVSVSRRGGYRIVESPDPSPFDMAIAAGKIPGVRRFIYLPETDSTNRVGREEENAIIFAESQTSGRGRLGRRWESGAGGIYTSITLNLGVPVSDIPKVTLLSGLAVCRALRRYGARIKWPNDVLINGRKVSGILSEFTGEEMAAKVIIGIGINVRNRIPEELKGKAISLAEIDDGVSITEVFSDLCSEMATLLRKFPDEWSEILEEWKALSDTLNREVRVSIYGEEVRGTAVDVDEDGGLIVRTRDGLKKVISGECFYTNY